MHNNYFVLKPLARELEVRLAGAVISACFSQEKDELVVQFETAHNPFFTRATLTPTLSCLSFPIEFSRARSNSVDLFPELIGLRVAGVQAVKNDRTLYITLSDNVQLVFKMHGNKANVLLMRDGVVQSLFRNNLKADLSISLKKLHREMDITREGFEQYRHALKKYIPTLGDVAWAYWNPLGKASESVDQQWTSFWQLLNTLETPTEYHLIRWQDKLHVSLVPLAEVISSYSTVVETLNIFFQKYQSEAAFAQERTKLMAHLGSEYERVAKALQRYEHRLEVVLQDDHFQRWGDLLMANLQQVAPGADSVAFPDFYPPHEPVMIRLRKEYSPQKNAEVYYRKAKNRLTEINQLKQTIRTKREQLSTLEETRHKAEGATNLKQVRQMAGTMMTVRSEKSVAARPYKEFFHHGFTVWVGKNAAANDTLIQQFAFKEDLWLHAKDVAGSHVLIKHQAGKPFPKEVIEFAARLAAGYSKRKTDSLCPVTVTPRKYVRKRKGDPPGTVVVERETVVLVEPWRET